MEKMKSIIQAMLEEIYTKAIEVSRQNGGQIIKAEEFKRQYFITLEQLEKILKEFES